MHYMESGVKQEVIPAYDEISQEYGYAILCTDCGNVDFMPECMFLDFVDGCKIDLIMDSVDDDEEMCQCPYCQGFRDGIEASMDTIEALDDICDCECGEVCAQCEPEYFEKPNVTINIENLILQDVENPKEFLRQIESALKKYYV